MTTYGRGKIKKVKAYLDDIPKDCGYEKKFRHDIDMNSNGIMAECIEWCQQNCEGKWGWWFEGPQTDNPYDHRWEDQNSYMSFEKRLDATRFWLSVGVENMGNNKGAYVK